MADPIDALAPAMAATDLHDSEETVVANNDINTATLTAAQRALGNHLILSEIFSYIQMDLDGEWTERVKKPEEDELNEESKEAEEEDDDYYHETLWYRFGGVLLRCMLVNKFWFELAVGFLWEDVSQSGAMIWDKNDLTTLMSAIEPGRRQMYTRHMVVAQEGRIFGRTDESVDLSDLEFPRLEEVLLVTKYENYLPRMKAPSVWELSVNPRYESDWDGPEIYTLTEYNMDDLLDQIAERFPSLRKLTFEDRAMAYEGTMDEFRKRMPMLTEINDELVTEVVKDTHTLRPWLDRPWSGSFWR
ncbi:hypothetical protein CSOJ01_05316 [Colletotrichum sojae]|uniref:Uncharacterized protein n=1 Tax=Colletotrichum sojae TaxID=2175907 RepID=A0A8H6MX30_9PEZI|nr:hypothetical protein CSOJ01_05316 [Colletotrichum sojae]